MKFRVFFILVVVLVLLSSQLYAIELLSIDEMKSIIGKSSCQSCNYVSGDCGYDPPGWPQGIDACNECPILNQKKCTGSSNKICTQWSVACGYSRDGISKWDPQKQQYYCGFFVSTFNCGSISNCKYE